MLPDLKRSEFPERNDIPTRETIDMQRRGMSNQEISNELGRKNFNQSQISDALSHASIKNEINRSDYPMYNPSRPPIPKSGLSQTERNLPPELLNAPSPSDSDTQFENSNMMPTTAQFTPQMQQPSASFQSFSSEPPSRASYEMVEEIVEAIVKEKWEDMIKNVGDIRIWKERMQVDTNSIKQEILRLEERFENMQKSIMGRLSDYDSGVREVGTDMKALEQVLQKILGPLSRNIKELEKIVEELKRKKK